MSGLKEGTFDSSWLSADEGDLNFCAHGTTPLDSECLHFLLWIYVKVINSILSRILSMYYRTKSDSVTDKNLPRNKSFAFICSMPLGFLNNTVTVTESGMSFYLAANKYAAHFQCISLSPASMCDARHCKRRTGEGEEPIQRQKLEQFIDQQR